MADRKDMSRWAGQVESQVFRAKLFDIIRQKQERCESLFRSANSAEDIMGRAFYLQGEISSLHLVIKELDELENI